MTIEKERTGRDGKRKPVQTLVGKRLHVTSLYTTDEDLSSVLSAPLTGVALDGSLTLMGIGIDHLPLLARIAIAKLWIYENQ